jgi:hypothetical protein
MENLVIEKNQHFNVLKNLINYFLFGNIETSEHKNESYMLSDSLVKLMDKLSVESNYVDRHIATQYFESICGKFYSQLDSEEIENLLECYQKSNTERYLHIIMLTEYGNSFEKTDNSSNLSTKEIPLEILAFLKLHFTDLLSEIPLHSEIISKTQYEKILEKFVRQLNDREIFDRVFS